MGRLELRLQPTDKEKIKKRAASLGLSMSDFVRQMALYGFAVQYRADILYDLIKAINRIGTNINQIAKICNESRSVSITSLRNLQREHSQLFSLLKNTLVLDEDRAKIIELIGMQDMNTNIANVPSISE